ncbi:MAG: Na/Pi cotransporter family protein [bacterium]
MTILSGSLTAIDILLLVIGGIGIFLFGIEMMGNALKALAGNKMKTLIEKTTNTPLKGILVGALVTVVIQSSSGTTALTVSFVRSGLMGLNQAVGIIMGANIGTTITSFLVGLNIQKYALLFVGVGAILMFFFKKEKMKTYGKALLGFGMLFYGLDLMSSGLKEIISIYNDEAISLFQFFGDIPVVGAFVGAVVTAVVQSSSAAIGILQNLYSDGNFPLMGALAILLGSNIGTTITALLASTGGTKESKQAAFIHFLFNVIGSVIFLICLWPYTQLMLFVEEFVLQRFGADPSMTISVAHMIFNVTSTLIMYFFINKLVWLAKKVIKPDEEVEDVLLDESIIKSSPVLALEVVKKSVLQMGKRCYKLYNLTKELAVEYDEKKVEKAKLYESDIDSLDQRVHDYLRLLIKEDLDNETSNYVSKYLDIIRDLERIGDHCTNIVEFLTENVENKFTLTQKAFEELQKMFDKVLEMLTITIDSIELLNKEQLEIVFELEKDVDTMEEKYRKRHFVRINQQSCSAPSHTFVEMLSNLERIADHCHNVSSCLYNDEYAVDIDTDH